MSDAFLDKKICLLIGWRRKREQTASLSALGGLHYTNEFEPVVYGAEFIKKDASGLISQCWPLMVTTDPNIATCEVCKAAKKVFDKKVQDALLDEIDKRWPVKQP